MPWSRSFAASAVLGLTLAAAPLAAATRAETLAAAAGHYAHMDVVAYEGQTPLGPMRTLVITYGFTDFTQQGDLLIETDRFCHAEHKSNLPMKSTVRDAFTQAIVPKATPVELTERDGAWMIFRPETPTPIGIRLAPNEPLPSDPKDPRIIDEDGDGHPGVTVDIAFASLLKGQIYLARRERFAYELTEITPDRLAGSVRDLSEQLIVGASPSFLATPNNPQQHPDRAKSPILLVRVDPSWTCDRLMAERPTLLPPEPEIWQ